MGTDRRHLRGYELHLAEVDHQMAINICNELIQGMNNLIYSSKKPNVLGLPEGSEQLYQQMLKKHTTVSANLVKTEIERRLMAREKQFHDDELLCASRECARQRQQH